MNRRWLHALLALAALLACGGAWAQECELREATGIHFGEYNPLANQVQDSVGHVLAYCNNPTTNNLNVIVCLGLREGSAGLSIDQRRMLSPNNTELRYQIYVNPARTGIFREISTGAYHRTVRMIPAGTNDMVPVPFPDALYGRILSGQQGTVPGGYNSLYTFPDQIEFAYAFTPAPGLFADCETLSSIPGTTVQPFPITATVPHRCEITAGPSDLDFGTVIGLEVPARTRRFGMRVRCTRTTSHSIALDDGLFAKSPGHRRMRGPDGFIDYDIYQDPGLTTRWGMTPGGATGQIMAPLTGTAANQNYIGYGRKPRLGWGRTGTG